jgi:hypothetical protein
VSRMSQAMTRLADRLADRHGESVTYARGATTAAVTAVPGRTNFRTSDANGRSVIERSDADFTILVAALTAFGEPAVGDRITWGSGVYEVYSPTGEPCFRTADQFGYSYRIHTRRES